MITTFSIAIMFSLLMPLILGGQAVDTKTRVAERAAWLSIWCTGQPGGYASCPRGTSLGGVAGRLRFAQRGQNPHTRGRRLRHDFENARGGQLRLGLRF